MAMAQMRSLLVTTPSPRRLMAWSGPLPDAPASHCFVSILIFSSTRSSCLSMKESGIMKPRTLSRWTRLVLPLLPPMLIPLCASSAHVLHQHLAEEPFAMSQRDEPAPELCPQIWKELAGGEPNAASAVASSAIGDSSSLANALRGASLVLHRNGEPEPCGSTESKRRAGVSVLDSVSAALRAAERCDKDRDGNQQEDFLLSKYETEALLTALLAESLSAGECGPEESSNATASVDFLGYCDMGPGRTVIQPDNKYLAMVPPGSSLPCRFYTREGDHVDSIRTLARLVRLQQEKQQREEGSPALESPGSCEWSNAAEDDVCHTSAAPALHLYAVPAGRVFMYAPSFVGERFVLDRMRGSAPSGEPVVLEVLSTNPRVFELHNFYSADEASRLIQEALSETSESHRFHRSTTGAVNAKVFSKRTSENAWLTHTDLAQTIKRRCLEFLGFDTYRESHTDGLQVLRYQNNQAYDVHPDYLSVAGGEENYNYDTAGVGGNRFATILLYMSEVESGGETVFPKALAEGDFASDGGALTQSTAEVIQALRRMGDLSSLKKGSWEESLTATCRSRLAIAPKPGRAVLFYSQHPNGAYDESSVHGACPVLNGTKWAANLWVWSAPRHEFEFAPRKRPEEDRRVPQPVHTQLLAEFRNTGDDPTLDEAELYYNDDTYFGKLGRQDPPIRVNTFEGHVWNVKVHGQTQRTFVIEDKPRQVFKV